MSVNIKEIAEYVAATENISKASAERCVRNTFDYIKNTLSDGNEVLINSFGKFVTEVKPARRGRNPKTGETIQIPEKTVVKFKPQKSLREEVGQ